MSQDEILMIDEGLEILDEEECHRLVSDHGIGRVGVTIGALPAIFPVNYTTIGGDVVFRTGEGTKLRAALEHAVVAFEVDHIDPVYHQGWSVQIIGMADEIDPEWGERLAVTPWAPGHRHHVIRIRPEMITGRRIRRDHHHQD
jgi:nitroimidazol reductase NimA-like FMN-containing flavoprotein (pyridoxamine 5'-phosphate oxidase superfamily)